MKTFKEYMDQVDIELTGICGLSSGDLCDVCYRDMYDDEVPAYDAAVECLEQSDYPTELL